MAILHGLVLKLIQIKILPLFSIWKCLHTVCFSPKCNSLLSTSVLPSTGKVSNYISAITASIWYWSQSKIIKKKRTIYFSHKNCIFVFTLSCTDTRNLSLLIFCRDQVELRLDNFHEEIFQPKVRYFYPSLLIRYCTSIVLFQLPS